ncbi:T9SS type A sorting domain-containing protein [Chryseobacterium oryzae]|uniref:T9SS type A sorting domain-containing protein n=1 Tax=Chryseobacterium oryzae TaxID=2929799 RepID=A0ABY4BI21_9FLAO|nr:T9SS type A sorting domain-containing protein [Chryseobacterium oryzae]UOE37586.1 T9SS type A sorting domain-containing protein [Chryseobacterium oryzae]
MKKIFTILGIVAVAGVANAQTNVLSDTFSYVGALTNNGWVNHSGTQGQLTSDGSKVNLVAGNSEDANKAFSSSYAVSATGISKADYSAVINVPSATGLSTSGDYFLMFTVTAGTTTGNFNGRLYIKGSATGYSLGVLNNGSGTSAIPTYGTEVPYGTASNILVTFIMDNSVSPATNTATLQIDSQPLLTNSTGAGASPATLAGIAIRQAGNATSGTGNVSISNLVARVYAPVLAISDFNKSKSLFVKNTFVKNDEITFGEDAKDVKVYTLTGQLLKATSVKANETVNVADLPKGSYLVTGTVNNQPVSQKILKD